MHLLHELMVLVSQFLILFDQSSVRGCKKRVKDHAWCEEQASDMLSLVFSSPSALPSFSPNCSAALLQLFLVLEISLLPLQLLPLNEVEGGEEEEGREGVRERERGKHNTSQMQ